MIFENGLKKFDFARQNLDRVIHGAEFYIWMSKLPPQYL